MAHVIGFLVSDESSWVTGQVLNVNGGSAACREARRGRVDAVDHQPATGPPPGDVRAGTGLIRTESVTRQRRRRGSSRPHLPCRTGGRAAREGRRPFEAGSHSGD
ncbi:hypothetical protein AB1046_08225 [Promicromonospora sp. Populi]|uniref:hypothetical protein n=1 Tax=Promicromonospora sp. Populi TaxID=3239420 RepID=UPI0034E1F54A